VINNQDRLRYVPIEGVRNEPDGIPNHGRASTAGSSCRLHATTDTTVDGAEKSHPNEGGSKTAEFPATSRNSAFTALRRGAADPSDANHKVGAAVKLYP
jgi:hypothetical protein